MGAFFASLKSLRRPSWETRRAPKRERSLIVEDLEGRQLLSQAIQPFVTLPTSGRTTCNMISGPDGDLWVGVNPPTDNSPAIDRIGLNGSVTSFPVPGNAPYGFTIDSLANGPDGNVWFIGDYNLSLTDNEVLIGDITPAGVVSEFPPFPAQQGPVGPGAGANGIINGPGGDLWFGYNIVGLAIYGQNSIGKVTTAGAVTLYPVSPLSVYAPLLVSSLAVGADGDVWFTQASAKKPFGRISPSGVVTEFPFANLISGTVANGPVGSLIVTGLNNHDQTEAFRVSTAGGITRYKIPEAISKTFVAYMGAADGSLWFSEAYPGALKIVRITAGGAVTSYKLSRFVHGLQHISDSMAVGQDGSLYVLDSSGFGGPLWNQSETVYRLSPSELSPVRGVGRT